jgi:transcriptional regulator with XRE-family HTH domain
MTTFGDKFKDALRRRDLTQTEAATLLKTTQSVVSYYSNLGHPPRRGTLLRIAEGLGLSVDELLGQKSTRAEGSTNSAMRQAPHISAMEALRARWRKRPQDRDAIRHLLPVLFPNYSSEVLAWLEKP